MRHFTEQELVRRSKLEFFKKNNIDAFGQKFNLNSNSSEIKSKFDSLDKEQLEELHESVIIAGRIMTKREKGKAGFMHLQDKMGQIQVYVRQDSLTELEYELFMNADLGDIVGIEGYVFRTNMGELSVKATKYTHLVKALRPLPEKYHGLADVEERFRRRYLDLITNENARRIAFMRPRIIRSIQNYLDKQGYTEVETPILGTILGGASARPFVTHHNTLDLDMYLRIATEIPLKKLLVGGMDGVYEIGRLFRNEGMDKSHNPEFTTIELYKAYADLEDMMTLTENILHNVAKEVLSTDIINYQGVEISLKPHFKRIKMTDAIKNICGVDFSKNINKEDAIKLAKEHKIELESHYEYGHIVNAFFEHFVEETLIEPTFVIGHPIEISPLAKKDSSDPRFTQRFELFILGSEYANAFTELNDPIDQYERFLNQLKEREKGNDEANEMDIDFVESLEYGMPPAGGLGIGIDRLIMLITDSHTIREVILFPHMKPRKENKNEDNIN
jgi:lysyl-tRNA synthetase class 2